MRNTKTRIVEQPLEELLFQDTELLETIDPNYDREVRVASYEWAKNQGIAPHVAAILFGI
jgi:hypothetical protein